MWPVLLDMTKEESMQSLRNLELQAYSQLVSALRAQGPLNPDKRKLLKDTSQILNIPQDRHKAEIRRAINDEKLNTIAYHVTGFADSADDWTQEGRRTVPLLPRMAPQTAFSAIADEVAESAALTNKQLPPPACTERKRAPPQPAPLTPVPEQAKTAAFRVPDTPKTEEAKKRKLCPENSSLAQHLLGGPKLNRTQAIYRQRTKALLKEHAKVKTPVKAPFSNGLREDETQAEPETAPKLLTPTKSFAGVSFKPGPSSSSPQIISKMCAAKKTIKSTTTPVTTALGQKLIVVSNAQTIQSNSILQKSLSLPLVKNISVKNLDKFKIVTTSSTSSTPQLVTAATVNNLNSIKHKVVTVKTNPTTKKVIPLSLLNSKGGIKVLPIGGKIVGKTTTTTSSTPLYIVSTLGASKPVSTPPQATVSPVVASPKENGKSSVLGDILKASGVTTDDFDAQIDEFRIPNTKLSEGQEIVEGEQEESSVPEVVEESNEIIAMETEVLGAEDGAVCKEIDEVVATVVEEIVKHSDDSVVVSTEMVDLQTENIEMMELVNDTNQFNN